MPPRKEKDATLSDIFELLSEITEECGEFDCPEVKFVEATEGIISDTYSNGEEIEFYSLNDARTKLKQYLEDNKAVTVAVGDYDAEVTSDGIIVGCQTVSFSEFDALAEAVEKVRNR